MVSPLTELKPHLRRWLRRLEIEGERIRLTDPPRAGKDLPRGQKSEQRSKNRRRELRLAFHQIILVATKRRPGVVIDVIFDKRDAALGAESNQ